MKFKEVNKLFDLSGKVIVVTGSAGLLGSHLMDLLIKLNADVSVLDNLRTGSIENIKHSMNLMVTAHMSTPLVMVGSVVQFHLAVLFII